MKLVRHCLLVNIGLKVNKLTIPSVESLPI